MSTFREVRQPLEAHHLGLEFNDGCEEYIADSRGLILDLAVQLIVEGLDALDSRLLVPVLKKRNESTTNSQWFGCENVKLWDVVHRI